MPRKPASPTCIPGFGHIYLRGNIWWMRYKTRDGQEVQKSTGQREQAAAFAELMRQAGRYASGEMDTSSPERVRFDALFNLLERDYVRRKLATLPDMRLRVDKHLRPWFGQLKVMDLRKRDVEQFVDSRLNGYKNAQGEIERLEPATVNKLLAYLRRAMRLGAKDDPPLVLRIPGWFDKLPEDNVRTGILSEEMYRALLSELPAHGKLMLVIGYHLGMRRGEILGLRWDQIDFAAGVIRLERKQTKARKPRTAPIYGDMRPMLEMALAERNQNHPNCAYVVHVDGKRIFSPKTAWNAACRRAGIGKALVHDLRRTAATNMDAAGISRERIKECVGWETDAMFARYQIGSEKAAVETGEQMEQWMNRQRSKVNESLDRAASSALRKM